MIPFKDRVVNLENKETITNLLTIHKMKDKRKEIVRHILEYAIHYVEWYRASKGNCLYSRLNCLTVLLLLIEV